MSAEPRKHPLRQMREDLHIIIDRFFDQAESRYAPRPAAKERKPVQKPVEEVASTTQEAVAASGKPDEGGDAQLRMFLDELSRKS